MYKTIFLRENEKDIFQALKNQGIKTKVFEHRLAELFNRVYNNYVGYYVFKQDDIVYKIIVLPKTIKASDSAEKEFVNYLLHYYRIKNIYKLDKEKNIPNSLLQLAFESNNSKEGGHHLLEKFQSHRYKAILQDIEDFFKRHKNSKRIKVDYVSQSIKHTLNLKRNLKELDKTKIHQMQSKDVVFSLLATITYNALKLFIIHKDSIVFGDKLFKEVKKLQTMLLKKYKIERGYKLSLSILQGIKLDKLFGKTEENRQLLVDIKSLFGFEQMYKDNTMPIQFRQDLTTTSLFINPSNFYEWYVYDILKNYADNNSKMIQFDKEEGTATNYYLNDEVKSSNPDYILTDEIKKVKIVIDAKWKNVNEFGDVKPSDYLKLRFDASLIQKQEHGVVSYLVYPQIAIEDKNFNMIAGNESLYRFHALEIDMDFTNRENSLSFKYDFKTLSDEMEKEQAQEHSNQNAVKGTQTIQVARAEIIQNLIEAETSKDKEELGGLFDEALWQQNEQLTKKLNVEIILDEVQEILDQFEEIMEDESITFLKSTSTIYAHYMDEDNIAFDYSMPGSGLWKLIEVELNTSFVRYIRYREGVISNISSWDTIIHADKEINIKWVKLNERDYDNKLKGLMFGQLKFLSKNDYARSIFNGIVEYDFDELWNMLDKVVKYRNEHAHIRAMSKDVFKELWILLFDKDENGLNQIQKLLIFKKNVKVFINER